MNFDQRAGLIGLSLMCLVWIPVGVYLITQKQWGGIVLCVGGAIAGIGLWIGRRSG
jgi:hypothetical protein